MVGEVLCGKPDLYRWRCWRWACRIQWQRTFLAKELAAAKMRTLGAHCGFGVSLLSDPCVFSNKILLIRNPHLCIKSHFPLSPLQHSNGRSWRVWDDRLRMSGWARHLFRSQEHAQGFSMWSHGVISGLTTFHLWWHPWGGVHTCGSSCGSTKAGWCL